MDQLDSLKQDVNDEHEQVIEIELVNLDPKKTQEDPTREIEIIKSIRGPDKVVLTRPNDIVRRYLRSLFIKNHIERVLVA